MTNTFKKQPPFIIAITMLAIVALVMLIPTEALFKEVFNNDFKSEYVGLALKMSLVFFLGYTSIKMAKIQVLAGLSGQYPWRFRYLNLVPAYLLILGLLSVWSQDFSLISVTNLMLLLVACLMVGFGEEYLFRGFLQPLFIRKYGSRDKGLFMSILLTSVFFGLFHLVNLTNNDNVVQVFIQVVYATFIGFFFGVLLLKTNKLIPIAITHGLINFFFSIALLPGIKTLPDDTPDTVSIAPVIIFFPLLVIGLLMYKRLDKKEILEKMEMTA